MSAEEKNTTDISADPKLSQGTLTEDDSDKEWQQSATQLVEGTFDATEGHHFYRPIDSYEGLHRWDPDFQWTEQEEKRIVRMVRISPCLTHISMLTRFALD
jgi:hypothetical protein